MTGRLVMVLVMVIILATSAAAQQQSPPAAPAGAGQTFDLKDEDIASAVGTVSRLYGVRVLAQEGLKGKVTANLHDASLETALTVLVATNGLTWRKFTLAVKPTDEISAKTFDDLIKALDTIRYAGMVMTGPKGAKATTIDHTAPAADLAGTTAPDGSKYTIFYYVYDPRPKPSEADGTAKEKQPGRITGVPLNTAAVLSQYKQWFAGLDPDTRQQVLGEFMNTMLGGAGALMIQMDTISIDGSTPVEGRIQIIKPEPAPGPGR